MVTDPDISLEISSKDSLNVYIRLLNQYDDVNVVGPMLKIIDVPDSYPSRLSCWMLKTKQFWRKIPLMTKLAGKKMALLALVVDH
ncbi:hypothetical protein RGQ13_14290 [Thalassotalea psychrophila]|uniref:Uncharacterized protein n=1 Tax=Thalassotalea psychrophila TaxID=3065647 RepID=A0ABY9TR30_9GAMM|nr:hypothetical protein RGQ13_14290 [Colwelliaceae bacterium SQ149]